VQRGRGFKICRPLNGLCNRQILCDNTGLKAGASVCRNLGGQAGLRGGAHKLSCKLRDFTGRRGRRDARSRDWLQAGSYIP
jgi:hypothetical protein